MEPVALITVSNRVFRKHTVKHKEVSTVTSNTTTRYQESFEDEGGVLFVGFV